MNAAMAAPKPCNMGHTYTKAAKWRPERQPPRKYSQTMVIKNQPLHTQNVFFALCFFFISCDSSALGCVYVCVSCLTHYIKHPQGKYGRGNYQPDCKLLLFLKPLTYHLRWYEFNVPNWRIEMCTKRLAVRQISVCVSLVVCLFVCPLCCLPRFYSLLLFRLLVWYIHYMCCAHISFVRVCVAFWFSRWNFHVKLKCEMHTANTFAVVRIKNQLYIHVVV